MTILTIRIKHTLAAGITLFCLTIGPVAQDRQGQADPTVSDMKVVGGRTYTNRSFAFSLRLPEGWTAYGRDASNSMMRRTEDAYAPADPATEAKIRASVERTDTLLTAFKYPAGAGVALNPTFTVAAEPLVKGVKTGEDALRRVRAGRLYMKYRTEVAEDIRAERIGGVEFAVMAERIFVGDLTVMQKYYMTTSKGYALGFVLVYAEDSDLKTLTEVINSVRFDRP